MKKFYVPTTTGICRTEIEDEFEFANETFVVHRGEEGLFGCSHFITGYAVPNVLGKTAEQAKEQAKGVLERALKKKPDFDFNTSPKLNTPENLKTFDSFDKIIEMLDPNEMKFNGRGINYRILNEDDFYF